LCVESAPEAALGKKHVFHEFKLRLMVSAFGRLMKARVDSEIEAQASHIPLIQTHQVVDYSTGCLRPSHGSRSPLIGVLPDVQALLVKGQSKAINRL
jgi:hypothetical protein